MIEEIYLVHAHETIRGIADMRARMVRLPIESRLPLQLPVNLGNLRGNMELAPPPRVLPVRAHAPRAATVPPNPLAWTLNIYGDEQIVLCHTHGHTRTGENMTQDERYRPVCRAREWDPATNAWSYRLSCKDRHYHTDNLMCHHHFRPRMWSDLDYNAGLDAMVCDGPQGNRCWGVKQHAHWIHIW